MVIVRSNMTSVSLAKTQAPGIIGWIILERALVPINQEVPPVILSLTVATARTIVATETLEVVAR